MIEMAYSSPVKRSAVESNGSDVSARSSDNSMESKEGYELYFMELREKDDLYDSILYDSANNDPSDMMPKLKNLWNSEEDDEVLLVNNIYLPRAR